MLKWQVWQEDGDGFCSNPLLTTLDIKKYATNFPFLDDLGKQQCNIIAYTYDHNKFCTTGHLPYVLIEEELDMDVAWWWQVLMHSPLSMALPS